jgi:hypothetical protein
MDADRSLKHDLAEHLRQAGWLTFTEVQVPGTGDGGMDGRVDVAAVKPHVYARKDIRAYEVKGVRSDFQRDVASQKWRRYLQVFHRVFFAAPTGVIRVEDVPDDAGLILRGSKGWTVVKSAKSHLPPALTADAVLALLYRGYEDYRAYRDLRTRMVFGPNGEVKDCKTWGYNVSRRLAGTKHELEEPLAALLDIVKEYLGKEPEDWSVSELAHRLRGVFQVLREFDREAAVLRAMSDYLQRLECRYGSDGLQKSGLSVLRELAAIDEP